MEHRRSRLLACVKMTGRVVDVKSAKAVEQHVIRHRKLSKLLRQPGLRRRRRKIRDDLLKMRPKCSASSFSRLIIKSNGSRRRALRLKEKSRLSSSPAPARDRSTRTIMRSRTSSKSSARRARRSSRLLMRRRRRKSRRLSLQDTRRRLLLLQPNPHVVFTLTTRKLMTFMPDTPAPPDGIPSTGTRARYRLACIRIEAQRVGYTVKQACIASGHLHDRSRREKCTVAVVRRSSLRMHVRGIRRLRPPVEPFRRFRLGPPVIGRRSRQSEERRIVRRESMRR